MGWALAAIGIITFFGLGAFLLAEVATQLQRAVGA